MISVLSGLLSGCSGFFDKDNTPPPSPLLNFKSEMNVHSQYKVKTGSGVGNDYLKLVPAVTDQQVFTADKKGLVTATNRLTGKKQWTIATGALNSAGPTAADHLVLVAARSGEVFGLSQENGNLLWKAQAGSEVLAKPAANNGVVVVKSIDGKLSAFSESDGHVLWHYHQTEPSLILRGASAPQIRGDTLVAGFANGNLAKFTLNTGSLQWQTPLAVPEGSFAIQRMIDVDADPIIMGNYVYAATYQGHIADVDLNTGKEIWFHEISSYTGMVVDHDAIFISDAKSHLWAFDAQSGKVLWRQNELEARNITGPAMMGNYIVVGDSEGYLHWLSKEDGHISGRTRVNSSAIIAPPVVFDNTVYVVTTNGNLAAYTMTG